MVPSPPTTGRKRRDDNFGMGRARLEMQAASRKERRLQRRADGGRDSCRGPPGDGLDKVIAEDAVQLATLLVVRALGRGRWSRRGCNWSRRGG